MDDKKITRVIHWELKADCGVYQDSPRQTKSKTHKVASKNQVQRPRAQDLLTLNTCGLEQRTIWQEYLFGFGNASKPKEKDVGKFFFDTTKKNYSCVGGQVFKSQLLQK